MKLYRDGDTFIAPKGSYFEGNVKINGNFIVPPCTHFWGHLAVDGNLELGPHSSVRYKVTCRNAVIGSDVKIGGDVNVEGDITVCDNAKMPLINAGGDVILRPGVETGDVKSSGTIYIFGKVKSGKLLGRQVKVLRNPADEYRGDYAVKQDVISESEESGFSFEKTQEEYPQEDY
ncbi:MAG: polymer-forming cytoskeletal protein [Methanomicrobium sp.]|nr:polymer-forming cytoskeletal protein [Methanomicrobium sp.]